VLSEFEGGAELLASVAADAGDWRLEAAALVTAQRLSERPGRAEWPGLISENLLDTPKTFPLSSQRAGGLFSVLIGSCRVGPDTLSLENQTLRSIPRYLPEESQIVYRSKDNRQEAGLVLKGAVGPRPTGWSPIFANSKFICLWS
jgi:hypothetical protein